MIQLQKTLPKSKAEYMNRATFILILTVTTHIFQLSLCGKHDLYRSAQGDLTKTVAELLKEGANPDGDECNGEKTVLIPIHGAISAGKDENAQLLIDAGCSLTKRNDNVREDALQMACQYKNSKIIAELLKRGCYPNSQNCLGQTPLHHAINLLPTKYHLDDYMIAMDEVITISITHMLLCCGASTVMRDINDKTAYQCALEEEKYTVARIIQLHEIKKNLNFKQSKIERMHDIFFAFSLKQLHPDKMQ
jgi:hypothetical protein